MACLTPMPLSPFIADPDNRFVLNERLFLEAVGIPESELEMRADEITPILEALFRVAA